MDGRIFDWSWDDYLAEHGADAPMPPRRPLAQAPQRSPRHGVVLRPKEQRSNLAHFQERPRGGDLARFMTPKPHADEDAASLPADHRAVVKGRSLFPTRRFSSAHVKRVLISGKNASKIGAEVRKGPWKGMPIYTLTLEERATCPRTCLQWRSCYGNAMPLARRHAEGPDLEAAISRDLAALTREHRRGYVVRLHILGDFYSTRYVAFWALMMDFHRQLRVFGYTAHHPATPIGQAIASMNHQPDGRWMVRFSVGADDPRHRDAATVIWRHETAAQVNEGLVCPAQQGRTQACATCGLCWAEAMRDTRIVFMGHGMRRGAQPRSA